MTGYPSAPSIECRKHALIIFHSRMLIFAHAPCAHNRENREWEYNLIDTKHKITMSATKPHQHRHLFNLDIHIVSFEKERCHTIFQINYEFRKLFHASPRLMSVLSAKLCLLLEHVKYMLMHCIDQQLVAVGVGLLPLLGCQAIIATTSCQVYQRQ